MRLHHLIFRLIFLATSLLTLRLAAADAPAFGVFPTVVIIAPDGTVRHKSEGVSEAEDIAQIDALLAEFRLRVPARPPTR